MVQVFGVMDELAAAAAVLAMDVASENAEDAVLEAQNECTYTSHGHASTCLRVTESDLISCTLALPQSAGNRVRRLRSSL